MGETVFPRTSGFFSRNARKDTRVSHLLLLDASDRSIFPFCSLLPRHVIESLTERGGNFVTIFHSVRSHWRKNIGRKGTKHEQGIRKRWNAREGGKNSNVHSAVHVVYVHSFVFFHSHLLYPTLTQPTSRGLFQGLSLLGFSCQPLKRNLPFGHCHFCTIRSYAQASTSSYHRVYFLLFLGFKRISRFLFP